MRMRSIGKRASLILVWAVVFALAIPPVPASACPFCSPPGPTLAEDVAAAEISVLGKRLPTDAEDGDAQFQVVEVLRGAEHLPSGGKNVIVKAFCPQPAEEDTLYLLNSDAVEVFNWATPTPMSPIGVEYLSGSLKAPAAGAERLAYFQKYLQSEDLVCRSDSYMEFAKAPYEVVTALRPHLDRGELVKWLSAGEPSPDHKRLYLTLLGVCGDPDDAALVADFLRPEKLDAATLDATVGCYITLAGEAGLERIERQFLSSPDVDLSHVAAVVTALRFHGEEGNTLPRPRIAQAMKLLLARPDAADQVIFDLSRWEDWSVVDRLATLFKENDVDYIRLRVITYLRTCPLPEAKERLAELEKIDPKSAAAAQDPLAVAMSYLNRSSSPAPEGTGDAPPEPLARPESTAGLVPPPTPDALAGPSPPEQGGWKSSLPPVRTSPNSSDDPAADEPVSVLGAPHPSKLPWALAGVVGIVAGIAVAAGSRWRSRGTPAGAPR